MANASFPFAGKTGQLTRPEKRFAVFRKEPSIPTWRAETASVPTVDETKTVSDSSYINRVCNCNRVHAAAVAAGGEQLVDEPN